MQGAAQVRLPGHPAERGHPVSTVEAVRQAAVDLDRAVVTMSVDLEMRVAAAKRECEAALQEAGRLRARVEELEAVARLVVEASAHIELLPAAEPGPAWAARVAL